MLCERKRAYPLQRNNPESAEFAQYEFRDDKKKQNKNTTPTKNPKQLIKRQREYSIKNGDFIAIISEIHRKRFFHR